MTFYFASCSAKSNGDTWKMWSKSHCQSKSYLKHNKLALDISPCEIKRSVGTHIVYMYEDDASFFFPLFFFFFNFFHKSHVFPLLYFNPQLETKYVKNSTKDWLGLARYVWTFWEYGIYGSKRDIYVITNEMKCIKTLATLMDEYSRKKVRFP